MVMKGTTPRTLGWKGSLGALALAGVLLPIAPTWAQKPPEAEQPATTLAPAAAPSDEEKPDADGPGQDPVDPSALPAEMREGIKKAVEELKGRMSELESSKPEGPEARAQIDALKTALRLLENMAARTHAKFTITSGPVFEGVVVRRPDIKPGTRDDDPEFVAARKRVNELQRELARKQGEVAEAARVLNEAQKDLAVFGVRQPEAWPVTRPLQGRRVPAPRIAEGRVILRDPEPSDDKARIDALERKLDRVLQQLEGLKKPEAEDKK